MKEAKFKVGDKVISKRSINGTVLTITNVTKIDGEYYYVWNNCSQNYHEREFIHAETENQQ